MILQIAGLYMEIRCDERVEAHLPNLKPFVTTSLPEGESPVCIFQTGQAIDEETTEPTLTSVSDDKTIRLWLKPEACKLSLHISSLGRTFWLQADREWKEVSTDWKPESSPLYPYLDDFIMIAFVYSSAFHHTATIHASSVAIDHQGCAFIGPSGIGKSTHSRLWLEHVPETRLLNDDQPVLRLQPDGTVCIYGSPWSGKTECFRNEGVELKTLFFMQQSQKNEITRFTPLETFQGLMKATSIIGRDTVTFKAISHTLASVSGVVPACLFKNQPTPEAVGMSYQAFSNCL